MDGYEVYALKYAGPFIRRQAFLGLDEEGLLDLDVWMNLPGQRMEEMVGLGMSTGFGSDRLKVGHLKFFTDGSMGTRTAWVLEPFEGGGHGLPVCSMEDLARELERADLQGLAFSVHAIGDRANQEVISILEDLAGRNPKKGLLARTATIKGGCFGSRFHRGQKIPHSGSECKPGSSDRPSPGELARIFHEDRRIERV